MRKYLLWFLLIIILVIRVIYFYKNQPSYPDGTRIRITSRISSEPIRYSSSQFLKLQGFKIYLPSYPEVYYGDQIAVDGTVKDGELKDPKLVGVKESKIFLYSIREQLIDFYQKNLPQPHSSLIAGVTIGSKASIPKDFWEALKKTGTAHVVVASGMNVTLVSQFLISFLALLFPRRRAIPMALMGVWSYAILSGFDAPIIRASIMGSLVFVAQEIGRLNFSLRALFMTAFAMLFVKPDWLTDIGFMLSFAATLSLILFEPKVDRFFKKIPAIIRKDFSTSLAAQVGVVPILYFGFGQFNVLSPVINAMVLWTIVPITIIGMVGGILGLIFEPVGRAVLLLVYPLTSWFVWILRIFN
ncbi:MAG: ComEC/Rec2-related protein [Candidatus Woesebacteria bacterium GW2011_GWB1_39_12]|uniref:ComEC/Rec2-related protein n=2 Tax=Candidatus Woeseibacteriota TaxID=1752722 RepID=A0A0G0PHS5_9BACT|nr:MAG: ComEC/Rec2-related protein [Candidatus Woesebacteria bacterium GW2011_GWA1_39_12]KKR01181.1 MAG: ComEC/Rec2-related protein [Candidatus Woesebacteria bacterium GW2011_GWB1_39_12]